MSFSAERRLAAAQDARGSVWVYYSIIVASEDASISVTDALISAPKVELEHALERSMNRLVDSGPYTVVVDHVCADMASAVSGSCTEFYTGSAVHDTTSETPLDESGDNSRVSPVWMLAVIVLPLIFFTFWCCSTIRRYLVGGPCRALGEKEKERASDFDFISLVAEVRQEPSSPPEPLSPLPVVPSERAFDVDGVCFQCASPLEDNSEVTYSL